MLISNQAALNIILSNNTLLSEVLNQENNKNPLLSEQNNQTNSKEISNLIKELFLSLKDGSKTSANLENIIKNSSLFRDLGSISSNISILLNSLEGEELSKFKNSFEPFLKHLKDLNSINLKEQINNSGIFLENKLLNSSKYKFSDDFKANLLTLQEQFLNKNDTKSNDSLRAINNLLAQIELSQLGSIASNSNFVSIPFLWDMLEDGFIQMKQKDEDRFFCQINLNLKDFGKVELLLFLYDENRIDITVYAQREHFKNTIKDNLIKLKKALNSVGLIASNIKLLDLKDEKDKKQESLETFEAIDSFFDSSNRLDIRI